MHDGNDFDTQELACFYILHVYQELMTLMSYLTINIYSQILSQKNKEIMQATVIILKCLPLGRGRVTH